MYKKRNDLFHKQDTMQKNKLSLIGIILSALIIVSCGGSKLQDHYAGFVVDEAGEPISGVLIRENLPAGNNDTTNSVGYFEIKRTDNILPDLIFSKKGYRTDTVQMVWLMHGEKEMYSDLITKDSSKWVMREIICRDSTLNWSDKLHFFDNDSIEMRRDGQLMYTQYLNRGKGKIIYRYYDYHGTVEREVCNIDIEIGQIHFRDYHKYDAKNIKNTGYISASDLIPNPLNDDWSEYHYVGVIRTVRGEQLLSETYLLWQSPEDCVAGRNGEYIAKKEYYDDDNSYRITKYTDSGTINWYYYPNGQLHSHGDNESLYGGTFSTFFVSYDSLGRKTEEINWKHSYPEWGTSYNDTFSVMTTRKYYTNGKLKSLTKMKSFCESDGYRCGTWIYYDERGRILKTENYGNCDNFKLEKKYADVNFSEDGE